jgi:hypothetical protein
VIEACRAEAFVERRRLQGLCILGLQLVRCPGRDSPCAMTTPPFAHSKTLTHNGDLVSNHVDSRIETSLARIAARMTNVCEREIIDGRSQHS